MSATTILDGIRIASPCPANWDAMTGDDRARSCSECGLQVYNIAAMTTAEAASLVTQSEGRLCIRLYRRADGTVLTTDCPVGARSARNGRLRKIAGLGLVGLAMTSTAVAALGFGRFGPDSEPSGHSTSLDEWVDWALVKIGWRTAPPVFRMGESVGKMIPIQAVPAVSWDYNSITGMDEDDDCRFEPTKQ